MNIEDDVPLESQQRTMFIDRLPGSSTESESELTCPMRYLEDVQLGIEVVHRGFGSYLRTLHSQHVNMPQHLGSTALEDTNFQHETFRLDSALCWPFTTDRILRQ